MVDEKRFASGVLRACGKSGFVIPCHTPERAAGVSGCVHSPLPARRCSGSQTSQLAQRIQEHNVPTCTGQECYLEMSRKPGGSLPSHLGTLFAKRSLPPRPPRLSNHDLKRLFAYRLPVPPEDEPPEVAAPFATCLSGERGSELCEPHRVIHPGTVPKSLPSTFKTKAQRRTGRSPFRTSGPSCLAYSRGEKSSATSR